MKYSMFLGLALTLGTSFATPSAHATGAEGHGGNVVICNQNRDFYLLDYVEATGPKNDSSYPSRKIPVPSLAGTVDSIVHAYLKNMRDNLDPRGESFLPTAEKMLSDARNFSKNGQVVGEVMSFAYQNLPDTLDAFEFQLPSGCEKKQLIVRDMTSSFPEDQKYIRKFMIDPQYWIHLDPQQQALAIMHELFYDNLAIEYNQDNSRNARYLNEHNASLIVDQCTWANLLEVAKSPIIYKALSPSFELKSADFSKKVVCENGRIAHAKDVDIILKHVFFNLNQKLDKELPSGTLMAQVRFNAGMNPAVESYTLSSKNLYYFIVPAKKNVHSDYRVYIQSDQRLNPDSRGNTSAPIIIQIPEFLKGAGVLTNAFREAFGGGDRQQLSSMRTIKDKRRLVKTMNEKKIYGNFHLDFNAQTLQIDAELSELATGE